MSAPFAFFIQLNGRLVECHAEEPGAFPAYRAPVQAQGVAQLSGNSGELADSNFPESDGISRAQGVAQSSLPPLPTPSWARDMHGETEVYTALEMQDYARAALAKAQPVSAELLDAAQGLIEILDN